MLMLRKYAQAPLMMACRGKSPLCPTSTSTTLRRILPQPQRGTCNGTIGKGTNEILVRSEGPDDVYLKRAGLRLERMPKHVLLMLDGTRRSCERDGRELTYEEPFYRSFVMFADLCIKLGIPAASFAIFATCTWKRTQDEVDLILKQFQASIEDNLEKFMREGMKVSVIGQKWRFSKSLQDAIEKVEEATKNGERLHITYLVSYGARWDISEATRSISRKVMAGEIEHGDIDEMLVQQHLSTGVMGTDVPNPDLLIRCGGKRRLSNFYLWQMAHAELYFSNLLLSNFREVEILYALRWFQQCERRFGR